MTPEALQKQALEWQERANEQKQKLVQLKQAITETEAQIHGLEGGVIFAQSLLQDLKKQESGVVEIGQQDTKEQEQCPMSESSVE